MCVKDFVVVPLFDLGSIAPQERAARIAVTTARDAALAGAEQTFRTHVGIFGVDNRAQVRIALAARQQQEVAAWDAWSRAIDRIERRGW